MGVCRRARFFPSGKRLSFVGFLAALGLSLASAQPSVHTLLRTGPNSNRFNIVLLSEGYTASQSAKFQTDATNALNALLSRRPFQTYRPFMNGFAVWVASAQSGSDHPAYGQFRSTYFNSSYDAVSDYIVTIPPNAADTNYSNGQGKIDALLKAYVTNCALPLLLVNDAAPGGSDGALTKTAIAYTGAGMADVLAHEAGHVAAGLGDEYTNAYAGFPEVEEPNTTRETRSDFIKWRAWFSPDTPLPTPASPAYSTVVGLFEGAHYHRTGWFRPSLDCAMNHPTMPFCDVCCEALVLSFYRKVRPVDGFIPTTAGLAVTSSKPISFQLNLVQPAEPTLVVEWKVDGNVRSGTQTNLSLLPAELGDGAHTVTVLVRDGTALVRNDPTNLLAQTATWNLIVNVPWVQVDAPFRLKDGRAVFRVTGNCPQGYILERAHSFSDWRALVTNSLPAREAWYTNAEALPSGVTLFRAEVSQ